MFNSDWGVMAEVPLTHRGFLTADSGTPEEFDHTAFGDMRLMGIYSGFSPDMSTGIIVGVKLPTGDHTYAQFRFRCGDRLRLAPIFCSAHIIPARFQATATLATTARSCGSTNSSRQHTTRRAANSMAPSAYRYDGWSIGNAQISPVVQAIVSYRGHDGGLAGDPGNTGYSRLLISPGVKADFGTWKLYADVEVPVAQNVEGNQLIAPVALKFIVSYSL